MNRPALSVVIAASESAEAVAGCLESLGEAGESGRIEVIVVADRGGMRPPPLPRWVRWIEAEPGSGVPRLRGLGLARAGAEVVAFTEDSCRLGAGWCEGWLDAFEAPGVAAATGTVDHPAGRDLLNWAVFFCEYAPFLGRTKAGSPRLAGNNFAVRRAALVAEGPVEELHEYRLADQIRRGGGRIVRTRRATAWHVRRFGPREAIGDRVRLACAFGRLRAGSEPGWMRVAAVAGGPLILARQVGRLAAVMTKARRHLGPFLRALPITLALLAAWSVGEWLGWASGPIRPRGCRRRGTAGRHVAPGIGRSDGR